MSVSQLSVRRPVLMTVMALVIVLLGFFGLSSLGIREYPNVDYPLIQVRTSYPGANAAVVEAEVTEILEASINSASGIKALTSTSRDGFSYISIEFETGMDLEAAANEIRDRVSRVRRRLPDDVDEPTVYKSDSDNDPILMVSLVSDKLDPMEVSEIANNHVKERLQTINGVSEVAIWGEKRPVVRLWIDPIRMQALGVSGAQMAAALKQGNLELPSGSIEGTETTLSIRTLGRILDPKSFGNIAVKTAADGNVIRISDVADIHYEPKDTRTGFRRNGKNSITLALMAQPGSNHVEIANEFYKRVEDIRREIPESVELLYGRDTSINIRASIKEVVETIFIAFVLVIAIIFAFLREGRTTFIPMVVVPVSVIGSFFVLYLCGFSINVLTLLAMVLAIGLVVDDAIVIVENIYHKIEGGMTPKQAAVAGTNEIFFAVIATSVVLMAVFVPVLALGGTTGLLFREFVAVMIGTVFLSTLCALTLSPMLCSKFLKRQKQGWFFRVTEPFFDWFNAFYSRLLSGFLRMRLLLFPIVAALFFAAYYCFNNMSSEMAPTEDANAVMVNMSMPEGVNLARTKRMADEFADEVISILDTNEYTEFQAGAWNAGNSRMRLFLNDDKKARRPQSEIARAIQVLGNEYPDLRVMVFEPQSISTQRGGLPVQFVLQAPNIEVLRDLVPKFEEAASKSPVFSVVNSNLRFTKPELHIEILRDKANEEGVSVNDIAQAVQLAISDQTYGDYYKDGRQYDIIGAVGYQYRDTPENLSMLTVKNGKGELVSLDNFITYKEQSASPSLPRYNRFSAATIQAGLVPGKTIGDGVEEMRRIAKKLLKDYPSVSTTLSGSSKEFEESSSGLYVVFLLALALVFLVLAGQFESFRAPFVIFFTVPLALSGALVSLFITGQTLNIFSE
ncbi:MAG: efflux RND transporter permease subunit, partial [Fibrobacter sp.]|nr:efflux RND transporter permease subunit [Fibrobacter sp.]